MILEAKDRGGGYMGALFSTLMSHGQAMSAKAAEYKKWVAEYTKGLEGLFDKPSQPFDDLPQKGTDADANNKMNPLEQFDVREARTLRMMQLLHLDVEIARIESNTRSAGVEAETDLALNDLKRERRWVEQLVAGLEKALLDKKIPPELENELWVLRNSRDTRPAVVGKIVEAQGPADLGPYVVDLQSGETVREAAARAFISAGVARQLPGLSFDAWMEEIGPNFRIYQEGIALGIEAKHVLNHDNAAMAKYFEELAEQVIDPIAGETWKERAHNFWVLIGDKDDTERNIRHAKNREYYKFAAYFFQRQLATYWINPDKRPGWKLLDLSTYPFVQSAAARTLSTTALAFLSIDVSDQQKLVEAGVTPYYKLINHPDFAESESFSAYLKKPAVMQRLVEDLKLAYGVSEETLRSDGIIDQFNAIVERGGIYLVDDLVQLFINGFVTEFIGLTKDVDWKAFDPAEFVKRLSVGKDIGGSHVYTPTSVASMSMVNRPWDADTDLLYSTGKFLLEGVDAGKIVPPPPSALTYDSSAKPYEISSADQEYKNIFAGFQRGMANDAVMTYIFHKTASNMNILEQEHLSMAGVFLEKMGFGAAIDKALKEGKDLGDTEDLCAALLNFTSSESPGMGEAAHMICKALTQAKKSGSDELMYTEENGQITQNSGKLSFNFGNITASGEMSINLKEVFERLGKGENKLTRFVDMNNALKYLFDVPSNLNWKAATDGGAWTIAVDDRGAWEAQAKATKVYIENGYMASKTLGRSYQSMSVQLMLLFFGATNLKMLPTNERLLFDAPGTVVAGNPLPRNMVARGVPLYKTPNRVSGPSLQRKPVAHRNPMFVSEGEEPAATQNVDEVLKLGAQHWYDVIPPAQTRREIPTPKSPTLPTLPPSPPPPTTPDGTSTEDQLADLNRVFKPPG